MLSITTPAQGLYRIHFFDSSVVAAFSGREFQKARFPDFLKVLDLKPESLHLVNQKHTARIVKINKDGGAVDSEPADGLWTEAEGLVLGIRTADCIPAFFYHPERQSIGLAHAGWRGLKAAILPAMVSVLTHGKRAAAKPLKVFLGPCVGGWCYEVGPEFKSFFPKEYRTTAATGRGCLDLVEVAKRQLADAGILPENVKTSGYCTACRKDRFYSVRGEAGTEERMLSIITRAAGTRF
jgi:YfiH family protein